MSRSSLEKLASNPNVRKFLDLLAYTEGTTGNGYRTAFGGGQLSSLADHPRYLKTFTQTDGKTNKTSAAGRYQFLKGTWDNLAKQYGLKDFGPRSQDLGAIALLKQNGALPYVLKGDWGNAVAKAGGTWASLPSSPHPQPTKSWAKVNEFLGGNIKMASTSSAPALSKKQNVKLYKAYKADMLDPLQKAQYEADVQAGVITLPKGAKLNPDAKKTKESTKPKGKAEELPLAVVLAYNNGELDEVQQAQLEADLKAGIARPPNGFSLKKPEPKGFAGKAVDNVKEAASKTAENVLYEGPVGVGKNLLGVGDAALATGGGLVDGLGKGYAGTFSGLKNVAQGKPFWQGFTKGREGYENTGFGKFTGELAAPDTEVGQAYTDVIAIPGMATEAAGKTTQEKTGSNVAGATVQGTLEMLGMLLPSFGGKGKAKGRAGKSTDGDGSILRKADDGVPIRRYADDAARLADDVPTRIVKPKAPTPLQTYQAALTKSNPVLDGVKSGLDDIRYKANQTDTAINNLQTAPNIDTANLKSSTAPKVDIDQYRKPTPDVEHLLDLSESKPKVGGVDIDVQGLRAQVLKDLGLDDNNVRKGAVTGDITQLETEKALSKLDTDAGQKMREQLDTEYETVNRYANNIIEDDIGARAGASPESRGQVIIDALDEYKSWYKDQVKKDYARADEAMAGKGGIELSDFTNNLNRDSLWQGKKTNQQLRRGIRSYLKEMDLYDADTGQVRPMTAKQAEGVRQYINSQWSPDSAGLIAKINESIDMGVFSKLDDNAYLDARKRYKQYKETFENPKGIAKILDVDGINRKVSPEQVGRNLQLLAAKDGAQFKHIYNLLDNMPDEIKPKGKRAKAEIQASIAESIINKGGLKSTNKEYMQFRRKNDDGSYKAVDIFGEDVAKKLDTYVAGRNVLQHHDPNPSGTATTSVNLGNWEADTGNVVKDKIANTAASMVDDVPIVGDVISKRIKKGLFEKQAQADLNNSLNAERAKAYRQANEQLVNRLINTDQMKKIIEEFEKPKPNQTKIKVLQKQLSKSKEWKEYVKSLPVKAQKAAMNNADVMTILTQGANQHNENEALAPTF